MNSPQVGQIVKCTDPSRRLHDPKGYRVEELCQSGGKPNRTFAGRGVAHGGLYQFAYSEWEPFN